MRSLRIPRRVSERFAALCLTIVTATTVATVVCADTSSKPYGSLTLTPDIYVFNNQWGNCNCGTQSITTTSPTSWSTSWNYGGKVDWKIRSYVAAILGWQFGWVDTNTGLPMPLASHTPIPTTADFKVTGNSTMDVAYDCWFQNTKSTDKSVRPSGEMMIWVADIGGLKQTSTPTTVKIDGITWDAYPYGQQGTPGKGKARLVQFVLHEGHDNYNLKAVKLNITDFTDFAVSQGWYDASDYISSVEFGNEIYNPGQGSLTLTDYSVHVGGGK
jgi:hypothetical protein